jgi:uncharacterized membrane protein YeaQ/YmgE (transglycosylase-associated protein family)
LAWLITGAWFVSFIADFFVKTYDPPPALHGMMMAVVGAAFVVNAIKKDPANAPVDPE